MPTTPRARVRAANCLVAPGLAVLPEAVGDGAIWATMSGPRVAARVRANGLSVTLWSASPSVSVWWSW